MSPKTTIGWWGSVGKRSVPTTFARLAFSSQDAIRFARSVGSTRQGFRTPLQPMHDLPRSWDKASGVEV